MSEESVFEGVVEEGEMAVLDDAEPPDPPPPPQAVSTSKAPDSKISLEADMEALRVRSGL